MKTEFVVDVALRTERPLAEEELFALAEFATTTGNPGGERIDATVFVEADDLLDAGARAIARVTEHVAGAVIAVNAMTSDENERRVSEPRLELVGILEITELLGVSKQRVFQLLKREDFPAPFAVLACGQVWRKGDLSTFADGWQRKPGRPRATSHGAQVGVGT